MQCCAILQCARLQVHGANQISLQGAVVVTVSLTCFIVYPDIRSDVWPTLPMQLTELVTSSLTPIFPNTAQLRSLKHLVKTICRLMS